MSDQQLTSDNIDHKHSEYIRAELDTISISDQIADRKQQLMEHVYRMYPHNVVDYKTVGSKLSVNRPGKRWLQSEDRTDFKTSATTTYSIVYTRCFIL